MTGGDRYKDTRTARFWGRVRKSAGCWIWTGPTNAQGYGRVSWGSAKAYAHRVAYGLTKGGIPVGMCLLHRCDNPICVNPSHLFLGTRSDNAADKTAKGRQSRGDGRRSSKLSFEKAEEIRKRYALGRASQAALAKEYGVAQMQISRVVRGVTWAQ